MKLVYRPQFWLDLEAGVAYLKDKASVELAIQWHEEVMASVGRVQKQPDLGRVRHDLRPAGVRSFVIKRYPRYLLFYVWQRDAIEVLRIKHCMMDLARLFP